MPWLFIIFRISHSCLAAKFGLIGPALVHIMGATITCNLKPLMIKSSFIHDCAPQSLGPITFFFFSISNSYFRHDISVRHQDYQITRGVAHEAHCEFPRSPVISVALHHVNCVNLGAFLRVKKLEGIFFKCTREFNFVTLKKKIAL